jgi:hypothetical protein
MYAFVTKVHKYGYTYIHAYQHFLIIVSCSHPSYTAVLMCVFMHFMRTRTYMYTYGSSSSSSSSDPSSSSGSSMHPTHSQIVRNIHSNKHIESHFVQAPILVQVIRAYSHTVNFCTTYTLISIQRFSSCTLLYQDQIVVRKM